MSANSSANNGAPAGFGRMLRKEDQRFIRGKGTYVDDVQLPGMLYGAVLRSPYPHARIVSVDTVAAEAHPKVEAVITGETLRQRGTWPGCQPCPATRRRCWPPTRSGSRARRWRSWSPRTATPPGTPSS